MTSERTGTAKRRPNEWWVAIVCGMASYMDAAAIVTSGIVLVIYQHSIGITAGQIGALSSALTLSIAAGAIIGGRLGDQFGRKHVFSVTMLIIIAGALLIAGVTSFGLMMLGMVLIGLGTGADLPVSIATISEAASDSHRGGLISFSQVFWTLGILAAQGLGAIFGDSGRWGGQIMYLHIAIVAGVTFILRLTIPESESWSEAHEITAKSGGTELSVRSKLGMLVKEPYLAPFIGLLVFYPLVNLAMNSFGQFGSYIFVNLGHVSVSTYSRVGLVMTIVCLLLIVLFMKVVDGKHRIDWFVFGSVCGVASVLVPIIFGINFGTLVVMLGLFQIYGAFAGEPIMKVWTQESFPTLLRSTAQGTIIAVARVLAAALASVTPLLLGAGPVVVFIVLAAVLAIGCGTAFAVFRNRSRNEFAVEEKILGQDEEEAGKAV